MKLKLALQIMDKCAEQAQFSVPKQAMVTIRKELSGSEKTPTNKTHTAIALMVEKLIKRKKHGNGLILIRVVIEMLEEIAQQQ